MSEVLKDCRKVAFTKTGATTTSGCGVVMVIDVMSHMIQMWLMQLVTNSN